MLVLGRKVLERILIRGAPGLGEITVTLVRIGRDSVRIGIDAPSHLEVIREELLVREHTREFAKQKQESTDATAKT